MGMLRTAIYLRISRDPKADGLANERQREDCELIASRNGWQVIRTYEDTASASKRNVARIGYERMRRDFDAGLFEVLICWDLDRLTRQPRQLEDWIEAAEEHGLRIVTANGEADLSTDGGRMFARIKASVARQEIERKGARQRRKNDQMAAEGLPHRSHRYFGWEADGITVRESEAAHLREATRRVLAGETLRSVIRYFEAAGVHPPRVTKWTHVTLRRLLLRERMAGLLVRNGEIQPASRIEPILPADQWEEVCALLTDPARHTSRGRSSAYWLAGVLLCECGSPLGGKRVHGRGGVVPTYVCRRTVEGGGYDGHHASIAQSLAEQAGKATLYFALAAIQREQGEIAEVATARRRLAEVDEQIARVEEAYALTGSRSSLSLMARLRADRDEVAQSLETAISQLGAQRLVEAVQQAAPAGEPLNLDSLGTFERTFRHLSIDQKRNLAKAAMRGNLRRGGGKGAKRIRWTTVSGGPLFME